MTEEHVEAEIVRPGPCVMVIFGASGDLTKRLLMPALYNLASSKLLPENFAVVGVAIDAMDTAGFREQLTRGVQETARGEIVPELWDTAFSQRLHYVAGEFENPDTYQRLKTLLAEIDRDQNTSGNVLFYLAVPPSFFGKIIQQLAAAELTKQSGDVNKTDGWRRVVIEKPFGHDLESAQALNRDIKCVLDENQIYRMDHYLGKETVQNILVFRFANGIFEPVWNRRYIDHVQITVAETVGVEHRGGYYEHAGAMRDMIPNHIFQLLALVGMESPGSFEADAVRDEKAKLLHAIHPLDEQDVLTEAVRGQYAAGEVAGNHVVGYRESPNVAPDSRTETFAAFKLSIDNWRWAGVPFYVRTGKCLPQRISEIVIKFKQAPFLPFRHTAVKHMQPNMLLIRIQPDEGISLSFEARKPGIAVATASVNMDFSYAEHFGPNTFVGYETLLYDCMTGDQTLFQRADFVEAGWQAITSILDVWGNLPARKFPNYAAGTWGPTDADELLRRDGRHWHRAKNETGQAHH
ncbi:MAG TPA: glucose-6-phosphate dehydrogenase [Planctomycetaceae bacterium]|nr:glucose-6-phosphate dehydrogenase [Planctomycetaceae bacterium]